MFGGAPPEEVVEEDVPVHVETTSSQQEHAFFNAAPVSSPSTPSIPVSTGSPMATNFSASPSFGSYNYAVQEEDTSAFKYGAPVFECFVAASDDACHQVLPLDFHAPSSILALFPQSCLVSAILTMLFRFVRSVQFGAIVVLGCDLCL